MKNQLLDKVCRLLLATSLLIATTAHANLAAELQILNTVGSRLQIFVEIEGNVPDWTELELTVTKLHVSGFLKDGEPFSVTPFDGSRQLVISRANAGSPRFLVGGEIPPGQIDQIDLTLVETNLLGDQPLEITSKRILPSAVINGMLKLRFKRSLKYDGGDVLSMLVPIQLGKNVFFTKNRALAFDPVLKAELFSTPPSPENFLNDEETLLTGPTQMLPELGLEIIRSKIYTPDGKVSDLTLLKDTGVPVSFSDVRKQNKALWKAKHGILGAALVDRIALLPDTAFVLADVWLQIPGEDTFQTSETTVAGRDIAHSAFMVARMDAAEPIAIEVSEKLEAMGATVLSVELHPPVLHIEASVGILKTDASQLANVIDIIETPTDGDILGFRGAIDMSQDSFWIENNGVFQHGGESLRIGILETDACINPDHIAFEFTTIEAPTFFCDDYSRNQGHSTAVASMVASYTSASDAGIYDTNRGDVIGVFKSTLFSSDRCRVNQDTLSKNPHLLNMSCIVNSPIGLDYAVYVDRVFVANGSGNPVLVNGEYDDSELVSCDSYNSLCVGGYIHKRTLGPDNFADDIPFGLWRNNPVTGREKPDLVGSNNVIAADWSDNEGFVGTKGTSFATPLVVGMAGLLIERFTSDLLNDPTLTRAVLMASASHPMAGYPSVPLYSDSIDDRAGAGVPRGDRAIEIMDNDQFFTRYVDRDDFDVDGNLKTTISFKLDIHDTVRVVLTYDQCRTETVWSFKDILLADMDLVLTADFDGIPTPLGGIYTNNSHVDNTEIIEFKALASLDIHVNTQVQHWDPCINGDKKTYMAIAWDKISNPIVLP